MSSFDPPTCITQTGQGTRTKQGIMTDSTTPAALSDDRLIRRLMKLVDELDLDRRDFVIFGSGPLLANGLRRHIQDLDVVARGAAWRHASQHGLAAAGSINGAPMAVFWGGLIQFSPGWISDDWNVDALIENAEIFEGLPFAHLADVLRYKQVLNRPKDRADIQAIDRLLRQRAHDPPTGELGRGRGGVSKTRTFLPPAYGALAAIIRREP